MKTILKLGGEVYKLTRDLSISKEPALKLAKARAIVEWIEGAKAELPMKASGFIHEYQRHYQMHFGQLVQGSSVHEMADQMAEATRSKWAAVALYLVELCASAMFFAIFFGGMFFLRLLAGAAVAILIGVAVTYSVIRYVRHDAEEQPDKMKTRITQGLTVFGVIWLLAVVGVLLVPRFEATDIGNWLFPALTGLVTLLSPILAAFCTAAYDIFGWSRPIVRKVDASRAVFWKVQQLEKAAVRIIHEGGTHLTKNIVSIIALLFLVAAQGDAAELRLLADVSHSVDRVQLARVIGAFVNLLEATPSQSPTVIRIVPFYDNPWTAAEIAVIQLPPAFSFRCEPPKLNELARISKAYAEAASRRHDSACRVAREQPERKSHEERAGAFANLRAAVQTLERIRVSGGCTAFYDAVRRAADQTPPASAVIFSDALESCHHTGVPIFGDSRKNNVFVVPILMRSRTSGASDLFEEVRRRLTRIAPFIRLIEPYRMSEIIDALHQNGN
jgi:hypothetical protein